MKRSFTIGLVILLLIVFAAPASGLRGSQALAAQRDHFRPSSPTPLGPPEDELSTPADFEAAAAAHPDVNSLIFVSRCRFAPFTNPGLYAPFSASETDAIVGDMTFSFSDGTTCYEPQNESNIVVNPTDANNVVTSANDYRYGGAHEVYTSFDGGMSFTDVVLPGWTATTGGKGVFARMTWCGDPALAFAPDGTIYYSGLVCNENLVAFFSGIAVASSQDGGLTWSKPTMVSYTNSPTIFNDKEFITTGPDGAVYISWTRFKADFGHGYTGSPIVLSKSTDGGVTWSAWVPVSDRSHPYNQGSFPLVAPDGTLFVAYEGSTPSTGYAGDAIILARSTDGGQSFTNTELARAYDDYNCYPTNVSQGRQTLSGEQFRINSFPSFAIDPTTGMLAIAWADDQMNASCGYEKGGSFVGPTNNQVKLITSSDGGLNWTGPVFITTDPFDKVYPAVAANDGRIFVSYYTRAYSPNTPECQAQKLDTTNGNLVLIPGPVCLDYAARSSTDNFITETRLSSQSSNPYVEFAGSFIGDYTGAAVAPGGSALAVWSDNRGNPGITNPNPDTVVSHGQ